MSYEPAVLLMSVGLYLATDSFDSIAVTGQSAPIIVYSAPIFLRAARGAHHQAAQVAV